MGRVMHRAGVAALLLVLLAAAPARPQDRRILIPIEEFLPPDTSLFVTLPTGRAALNVLARAGEDQAALAARLGRIGGAKANAAPARLGVALLPARAATAALGVDDVAAGPTEVLWSPDAGVRIRYPIKEGDDLPPHGFGDLGRIAGRDLLAADSAEALAAAPAPGEEELADAAGRLRAPLPVLLAAIGVPGGPAGKNVVWRIRKEEDAVVVTTGRLETGPFAAIFAALTR